MTVKKPTSGWNLRRVSTHPGEMLREEFLIPLGITQNALALKIRVPATRIGDIVHGRRAITPDTALRLARFFGNSPEFWLNLQQMHDLSKARLELNRRADPPIESVQIIVITPVLCRRFSAGTRWVSRSEKMFDRLMREGPGRL